MNDWIEAESRAEKAQSLYEQGRWAEAAAELRAAIDIVPYNPAWYFNLALTLEAMEDYTRACRAYQSVLSLAPEDVEALNCLGMNLTRLGRYAESLRCFRRAEQLDPTHEPTYCNRIVTYTEMGRHEQAEVMFYLARQLREDCPLCYHNIACSLYARGDTDRAMWCWRRSLELDPAQPDAHARLAEAHWARDEQADAARHYQAELRLHGDDIPTLLDYGELLMDMGRLSAARRKFRRVLEQAPDNPDAHYYLGELALLREQLEVSEEQFRLVLRLDRDYPGARARLARVLLRRGRDGEARPLVLQELKLAGDDPEMLRELAELLIEIGQVYRANRALRRLVALQPDDASARHNLAVSFFMLDKLDDGIRQCRRALKLRPNYPLALYNLALAHWQKGDIARARRYMSRAVTLAPRDESIRELAGRIAGGGLWRRLRLRLTPRRDMPNISA